MNVGMSFNPAMFALGKAPSGSQINAQAAVTGGVQTARDSVVRETRQSKAMKLVGNQAGLKKVLDKAGITKVAGAKKR